MFKVVYPSSLVITGGLVTMLETTRQYNSMDICQDPADRMIGGACERSNRERQC